MCDCHEVDPTALTAHGQTLAGVEVWYPKADYTPNFRLTVKLCPAHHPRVVAWMNSYSTQCSRGMPSKIVSVGMGGDKLDANGNEPPDGSLWCKSRHEFGKAVDLTALEFPGKYWWNNNYSSDKKFTMGIEASCHNHFRDTIGHHYDNSHKNHIHFDDKVASSQTQVSFSGGSKSQGRFLRSSLNDVWGYSFPLDPAGGGSWLTNDVRQAVNGILAWYGQIATPNIETNPSHWRTYCRLTFTHGTV